MLKNFRYPVALPRLACLVMVIMLLSSPVAFAQSGYFVAPWLSVDEIYDDNIFFDTENEVSDFYTRVSVQLGVGFESETLYWLLSFQNDAEWYNDLSDLDSTTARQFGIGTIEYELNRRWTLTGDVGYTESNSAEDITLTPGGDIPGLVGRVEAKRMLLGGGASYLFSPNVIGDLEIGWVQDEVIDSSENETLSAITAFEQILTPARSILYGYEYRNYDFLNFSGTENEFVVTGTADSNTAWVGMTQALSETTNLELRVGPRDSDGDLEPYFLLNWSREYARGSTVIRALWDETTLLGEVGIQDSRSVQATWNHEFSSKFDVSGTLGYAYLTDADFTTDISSFDVAATYRFTPGIFMTARYGYNAQDQSPAPVQGGRVTRNFVSIAITFTRPRNYTERS